MSIGGFAAPAAGRDAGWWDAQYNPLHGVADPAARFAPWRAASALALSDRPAELDLPYGPGPLERLDFFPAQGTGASAAAPAPVLVFFHGGYWRSSDKALHRFIAPAFVRAGVSVCLPNYALCPAVTLEQIACQAAAAVGWVYREAEARGIDRTRIVVAGHSAGAQLAAMMLACRWAELGLPTGLVRHALGISGLYELGPLRHTRFLGEDLRLDDERLARVSPARWPAPAGGRLHLAVGGAEPDAFHWQSLHLRERWGPQRVPVRVSVQGRDHFSILDTLAAPQGRLFGMAMALLSATG